MNETVRKWLKYAGTVLVSAAYILLMAYLSSFIPLDGDRANHLLQAQDIISGNLFLQGWNLTGVTFLTTDLPFYEAGQIITGGISPQALYAAVGLMAFSVMALSLAAALFGSKEHNIRKTALFAAIFALPCLDYMVLLRVHTGAICWSLVSLMSAVSYLETKEDPQDSKSRLKLVLVCISLALGIFGDMLTAAEAGIPIILYCLITMMTSEEKLSFSTDRRVRLAAAAVTAPIMAALADKLYFWIGQANKNSYIGGSFSFSKISDAQEKLWVFLQNLMNMGDAGFSGHTLGDIWNLGRLINAGAITIALILIGIHLWNLLRGKQKDALAEMLSLAFLMVAGAFIFLECKNTDFIRYTSITPAVCFIVLVRGYEDVLSFMRNRKMWFAVLCLLAGLSFICKIQETLSYPSPEKVQNQQELAAFLKAHNLHSGYASFDEASPLTVISGGELKIRHIMLNDKGQFIMYNWFNKPQWYAEEANFIIIFNKDGKKGDDDVFGISEKNAVACFGMPQEAYKCNDYLIFIYNRNLAPYDKN